MAAIKRITTEVLDVLASLDVEGAVARITDGQLDRKLYVDVDKVLKAMGGKWNRSAKGHVFESDPSDAIDQAVITGEYTDKKQSFQFFETPEALTEELVAAAQIMPGMRVLEPSAGRGRIARAIKKAVPDCDLYTVEIDRPNIGYLINREDKLLHVFGTDFMEKNFNFEFDRVVANPPFSRHQDTDHVTRAFSLLKPTGRLVSVVSSSATHRIDKKGVAFAALVKKCGSYRDLPEGTFKESGTMVRAGVVVLDKE